MEAPIEEVIFILIRNTGRSMERHPGFFRALFERNMSGGVEPYLPVLRANDENTGRRLSSFLRSRGVSARAASVENCLFALKAVQSILLHRMMLSPSSGSISSPELAASLTRMMMAYIGIRGAPPITPNGALPPPVKTR